MLFCIEITWPIASVQFGIEDKILRIQRILYKTSITTQCMQCLMCLGNDKWWSDGDSSENTERFVKIWIASLSRGQQRRSSLFIWNSKIRTQFIPPPSPSSWYILPKWMVFTRFFNEGMILSPACVRCVELELRFGSIRKWYYRWYLQKLGSLPNSEKRIN